METIKERSEFIRQISLSLLGVSKIIDYVTCADREKYAFIKGVEFAEEWIPIEEELPEIGNYILTKNEKNIGLSLPLTMWDIKDISEYSTHWRPVKTP